MIIEDHALWAEEPKNFFQALYCQLGSEERIELSNAEHPTGVQIVGVRGL
jgi:hypothetical protein